MEAICLVDNVSDDYMHIIDKSWLYGITVFGGQLAVNFGSGWWYSGETMPLSQWTYVCGSFDGSTIRLYVNGQCVAHAPYAGFNGDASYDLGIGNAAADSHNVPFLGIIDEIRISKSIRGDSEIAATWEAIESARTLPNSVATLTGNWSVTQSNANIGVLNLLQDGTVLTGESNWTTHSNGPIAGSVSGSTVHFTITYPEGVIGSYSADISADRNSLTNGITTSSTGGTATWSAVRN